MSRIYRLFALALLAACVGGPARAEPPKGTGPSNSDLDGELFFELLVSEMQSISGDRTAAYGLMLNAARKSNSPRLYERAIEMAYQSRNGEAALEAAQAWARAQPSSRDANRYQFQLLLGMNRIAETQEPLKRELASLTAAERADVIPLLPRYFGRASDKKLATTVVEKVLLTDTLSRSTGPTAWATIGVMRLQAEDTDGALEAARRGIALNPESEEVLQLAIALISPKSPEAEAMVRKYLAGKPTPDVRMAYARSLINAQRYAETYTQVEHITTEKPDFPDAWLLRGSLELQDGKLALAETSLNTYVSLNPTPADSSQQGQSMSRSLVQAYLLLSQVAEQSQRLDEAKAYLDRIASPKDALRVQRRHASILARQGKLEEARAAIRGVPELQASDALDKLNAEAQLLRDSHEYAAAHQLLQEGMARYPNDTEIVYDLAMMAEKLGKPEEMERLLRQVIQAKPDYHHAYNALGYSLADRNIRLPEARQLINQALAFAPDDPFIMDSLAWVEFRSGNATEAIRLLRNAFQARPDAEIAAHLGEVLWSVGQLDQATAIWKEGVGLNPQNETLRETMRRLRGTP